VQFSLVVQIAHALLLDLLLLHRELPVAFVVLLLLFLDFPADCFYLLVVLALLLVH
jgi:hypothetical protein